MKTPVIVIAAGGTGGHIFPAIATGQAINNLDPSAQVLYACGERPLEIDLYQRQGISPRIFPSRQLKSGFAGKVCGVFAALINTWRAMVWLKSVKADCVIGFGGYVAGPTVLAGVLTRRKTAIHEANSVPGKTNRILGRWMDLTAVHFESTLGFVQGENKVAVGMPIRDIVAPESTAQAREALGLDKTMKTILVIGGSQGARYLYETIMEKLGELESLLKEDVQILWSTGQNNFDELQQKLSHLGLKRLHVHLVPFITDMGSAIRAADFAIARAGASAMAELLTLGRYAIYVPLPSAIYDHQRLNAQEAARYQAGLVLQEQTLKETLVPAVLQTLDHSDPITFEIPESLNAKDAAKRLARHILNMI